MIGHADYINDDGNRVTYKPGVYAIHVTAVENEQEREAALEARLQEEDEEQAAQEGDDFIEDDIGYQNKNGDSGQQEQELFEEDDQEL